MKEVLPGEGGEGPRGAHAGHGERARAGRLGRGGAGARAAAPGEIKVVRAAHDHDRRNALRMAHREVAHLLGAKIVTDEHCARLPEGIEEAEHVLHHVVRVVHGRFGRPVAAAVAALIGRERAPAGGGDRGQLMPEAVPQPGKAMAEDHRDAAALGGHVQRQAVGFDLPVGQRTHPHMMRIPRRSRHASD